MKISDINRILDPGHQIRICNIGYKAVEKSLYFGKASNTPDSFKNVNIVNIEADDYRLLTIYIDERSVF